MQQEAPTFTIPPQAMRLNFHSDGVRAVLPDSFSDIPEVFSVVNRQRVDAGKLEGADPQLIADLQALGYATYTLEAMGKPLYTTIFQDRDVSLEPYQFDPSVRQSLVEQGFKLLRTEVGNTTSFASGGQWGESQGVLRIEYGDEPIFVSTQGKDAWYAVMGGYKQLIGEIADNEKRNAMQRNFTHGYFDQDILVSAVRSHMGPNAHIRYERIPVAILGKPGVTGEDTLVRYFPDARVAVDENGQKLPIENADKRERHVVPWEEMYAALPASTK